MKKQFWMILGILTLASSAHAATAKTKRAPSSVEDCTPAAGHQVEGYMRDKLANGADNGMHHELYKKFAGKNGEGEMTYVYMYQLTDKKGAKTGIIRVTDNKKCENTTIGQFKDEEDMDADDHDAMETGGE